MPKRGTPTEVPGVTRDGNNFIVRAVVKTTAGRRVERQKMIEGAKDKLTRKDIRWLEDEQEALKRAIKKELEDEAANKPSTNETLSDFAPRWIEHTATTGRTREHVAEKRLHHLNAFILPILGNKELREIRRSDVAAWMEAIAKMRQPSGALYNRHTLMGVWATLRGMLKKAVLLRDLDRDPTAGIAFEIGDHVAGEYRPTRPPKETANLDELTRIIQAAKGESPDIAAMIIVQVSTGMRFCEVSALEWADIDLEGQRLKIQRSQVGGQVGPPKTEATRRDVYLSPAVVEALRAHQKWQDKHKQKGLERDLVFPSSAGSYRFPAILQKPLARCCKLAGVSKHLSSHSLRKTANNLLRQATSETVARAMMGHATSEMTRLYSNVGPEEKAKAHQAAFGSLFALPPAKEVGAKGGNDSSPTRIHVADETEA